LYGEYKGDPTLSVYSLENTAFNNLSSFLINNVKITTNSDTTLSAGERNAYNSLINAWYQRNKNLDAYITTLKAKYEVSEASTYFM
jgi:hypothetical protein